MTRLTKRIQHRLTSATFWLVVAAIVLYLVWPVLPRRLTQSAHTHTIVFYGFSILGEVMNEGIFPAFQKEWEEKTGDNIQFISSFAGSGTITNQILLGAPAEVAIFAIEGDARRIRERGYVQVPERPLPYGGVVNRTPFVIVVRKGNPYGIRDFAGLGAKPVGIVHPDPLTSGGAQWAILAEYGSALERTELETGTRDPEAAHGQLLKIWKHVVARGGSARAARTQFDSGYGDALITYEQEAVSDMLRGRFKHQLVVPDITVLSEHRVLLIDRNISKDNREVVEAFAQFLWSPKAQRIFSKHGFRPMYDVGPTAATPLMATIKHPLDLAWFGGWERARAEVVLGAWQNRVLKELGK